MCCSQRSSKNWHIVFGVGKGDNGMVIALNEGTRCWRDKHIHPARSVTCKTQSERVVSHVWSMAMNGHCKWAWTQTSVAALKRLGFQLIRWTFCV